MVLLPFPALYPPSPPTTHARLDLCTLNRCVDNIHTHNYTTQQSEKDSDDGGVRYRIRIILADPDPFSQIFTMYLLHFAVLQIQIWYRK